MGWLYISRVLRVAGPLLEHNKEERITAIITSDFIATTLTYIHSINVYYEGIIYTLVASVVVVTGRGGDFAGVVGSTPPPPPH